MNKKTQLALEAIRLSKGLDTYEDYSDIDDEDEPFENQICVIRRDNIVVVDLDVCHGLFQVTLSSDLYEQLRTYDTAISAWKRSSDIPIDVEFYNHINANMNADRTEFVSEDDLDMGLQDLPWIPISNIVFDVLVVKFLEEREDVERACAELDERGFRPLTFAEYLGCMISHRSLFTKNKKNTITTVTALSQKCSNGRGVAEWSTDERVLSDPLINEGMADDGDWRLLFTRK